MGTNPEPYPVEWDEFEDETSTAAEQLQDLARMAPSEREKATCELFPWLPTAVKHCKGEVSRAPVDDLCEAQAAYIVANRLPLDPQPFLELARLVTHAYCDLPDRPEMDPIWSAKDVAERLSRTLRLAAREIARRTGGETFGATPTGPDSPRGSIPRRASRSGPGEGRSLDVAPSELARGTPRTAEELAEAFRRHGKKGHRLPAALVEFMADRQSATSETILREVHDHQGTDCTRVKALVLRTNALLEQYGADFRFKKGAGCVLKVPPGCESEELPISLSGVN